MLGAADARARGRLWVVVSLLVTLALVLVYIFWPPHWWPKDECGGGARIWRTQAPHRECIGTTDGSEALKDSEGEDSAEIGTIETINSIQEKIAIENKDVAKGTRYVKVVLLMPLTVSAEKDEAISLEQIQYSLAGLYTAQRRINKTTAFGDPGAVKLQLLLANQGSRQEVGDRFVNQVLKLSDTRHPLVAAIGMGSSVTNTETIARKLADEGIPMVSAITSADSLTGLRNYWSVSPSNIQYATALRHFLDHQEGKRLKSGLMVLDANKDPYPQTLAKAFRARVKPYLKFPELTYTGGTLDARATPKIFAPVVTNLCNAVNSRTAPLDMVFYAGRVADFEAFAQALQNRTCVSRPLAILVGATGFAAAQRYEAMLRKGNVTVIYATSSDSKNWTQNAPGTPPDFRAFAAEYAANGFKQESLADGMAIAHHDAFATAALATRLAAQGRDDDDVPTPADVATQFSQLVLAYQVQGAQGRLEFPNSARGRAANRGIPFRQIGTGTSIMLPRGLKPYWVAGP